jgi:hypothetical protein
MIPVECYGGKNDKKREREVGISKHKMHVRILCYVKATSKYTRKFRVGF